jgi:hypothetical protein
MIPSVICQIHFTPNRSRAEWGTVAPAHENGRITLLGVTPKSLIAPRGTRKSVVRQADFSSTWNVNVCRDSTEASSNLLKRRVTDGFFWRSEVPLATLIGPLSDPRPLPCKPLPIPELWPDERDVLFAFDEEPFAGKKLTDCVLPQKVFPNWKRI